MTQTQYSTCQNQACKNFLEWPMNNLASSFQSHIFSAELNNATSARDLRPLLKAETSKKGLGDNFENGSGGVFQKSLKMMYFFKLVWKRVHCQTVFEKIPHPGARAPVDRGQGPGPRPQPGGVFFQTQFENGSFVQNSLKNINFSIFLRNTPRTYFQKCHGVIFFNVSPFHKGCKSIGLIIINPHVDRGDWLAKTE